MSPQPQRPPSVHQVGAMERHSQPIATATVRNLRSGAPFSPGSPYACMSPTNAYAPTGTSPAQSVYSGYFPSSPRASAHPIGSSRGSASPDGRQGESNNGLGIPWRLWQGSNRWDFVDDQVMNTNTQVPLEKAYTERNGWTEIMQTWVRREAIEEARYSFNQVQKEMPDGNRTRFETCFCIGKPLTYVSSIFSVAERHSKHFQQEIRSLVDRSIELFRHSQMNPRLSAEFSDSRSVRSANSATSSLHRRERIRRTRSDQPHDDYYSTTDSDSDVRPHPRRTISSSSAKNGKSSNRRKKESRKSGGSSHSFGTLAKYGGLATLLEGLPEILRGI